jgi:hypothetical protein
MSVTIVVERTKSDVCDIHREAVSAGFPAREAIRL